jgi:peptidoglycan/LPS O-acetylase OafA/YrhL
MTTSFRPEIEGLRAIAVLPIMVFHLDPALMPGGFIGVDIFFVISGYLITRMILSQGEQFTFYQFYKRRFCRLFPALLVTCLACMVAGWKLLPPADYIGLSYSALAAIIGASNIYFYATLNYFSDASVYHALLHTWSLGVEEQFYLFWPALLVVAMSWRAAPAVIAGIFLFSVVFLVARPIELGSGFSFYMMPTRIFQFGAGALLVCIEQRWQARTSAALNAIMAFTALAVLLASLWLCNKDMPWPGIFALVPTLATSFLILTACNCWIGRFLANPLFRFLGRISYSLYLVHWPVVVFHRYINLTAPSPSDMLYLFALMLGLGTAMYYAVEKPFRLAGSSSGTPPSSVRRWMPRTIAMPGFRWALVPLTLLLATASVLTIAKNGIPERLARGKVQHSDKGLTFAGDLCSFKSDRCAFGARAARRTVYLIGDSHALNWVYGLDIVFKEAGIRGIAFYDHGCLFLPNVRRYVNGRIDEDCERRIAAAYAQLSTDRAPVILALSYQGYEKQVSGTGERARTRRAGDDYYEWLHKRMESALDRLQAGTRKVILVRQTYSTGINLPKCFFNPARSKAPEMACKVRSQADMKKWSMPSDSMIDRLNADYDGLHIIDPTAHFCRSAPCEVQHAGELFIRDTDHLTNAGSAFLSAAIKEDLLGYLNGP